MSVPRAAAPQIAAEHVALATTTARAAVDQALDLALRARREAAATSGPARERALDAERAAHCLARALHEHAVRLEVAAVLLRDPVRIR